MKKLSQNKKILKYLQGGKSLTAIKALELFHCLRLAARIKDLCNEGHRIKSTLISTEYSGKSVAEYRLTSK